MNTKSNLRDSDILNISIEHSNIFIQLKNVISKKVENS